MSFTEHIKQKFKKLISYLEDIEQLLENKFLYGILDSRYKDLVDEVLPRVLKMKIIQATKELEAMENLTLAKLENIENIVNNSTRKIYFVLSNEEHTKFIGETDDYVVEDPMIAKRFLIPLEAQEYHSSLIDDIETWKEAHKKDNLFEALDENDALILEHITKVSMLTIRYTLN